MGRKLHLKENAITDMRGLGLVNINRAKDSLDSYVTNYVNLQDSTIREIPRPRTFAAAKKNPYPIIGIKQDDVIYQGYNKPRLEGPSIQGVYGNDGFTNIDGEEGIRANFAACDKFYEIVPINPDSYKNASDIRKGRERTYNAVIDDDGDIRTYFDPNTDKKIRRLTQAEIDAYDPSKNRKRYTDILSKNHLNKYITRYNELCDMYKEFMNRLHSIDIRQVSSWGYSEVTKNLSSYVDAIYWVNSYINDIDKGNTTYVNESVLQRRVKDAEDAANKLEKSLSAIEEKDD